ncbi:MAG: sulfatase family protein [Verrucomicrobiales bacterium]
MMNLPLLTLAFVALLSSLSAAEKPNILIIYADDLGYGDLGAYHGASKIPTPHLDRLAGQGMRFTDGHSSSGICTPSRYALLTGQHHWRDFHDIVHAFGPSVFKAEQLTLPEMLKAQGYRTAAIGKWHLGWDWGAIRKEGTKEKSVHFADFHWDQAIPDGPLAHGFDFYFGDTVINFPPYCWIENDKVTKAPDTMMDPKKWRPIKEGRWECRPGPMVSDWDPYENIPTLTRKAEAYLDQAAKVDEPFFLYFAFPSPHAPIIPNDEFDGTSGAGPYGDFVVETDASVGRLLAALEKSGRADNTIVIFTADNGPEHYAYPRDEKFGHWSAHPLRGLKRDIYEGGHRVPFIVRWPGQIKAGAVNDALVSQIDLMATLASVVGAELPDHAALDSHDLLPLWRGDTEPVRRHHVHNTYEKSWAMREGEWLLIVGDSGYISKGYQKWEKRHNYPTERGLQPAPEITQVELYHLAKDPGQRRNLAAEEPEKVAHLLALLKKVREDGRSAPRLMKDQSP